MGSENSKYEKSLASDIMEKYRNSAEQKRFYEIDVTLNLNFIKGETFSGVDGTYRILEEYQSFQSGQVIEEENYNIIDSVRREYINRLTRTFPLVRSKPKTQDYNTKTKATITNKIIEKFETDLDIRTKYKELVSALVDTGTVGFFPIWDRRIGKIVNIVKDTQEVEGQKQSYLKITRSGGLGLDMMYFWEMFPESIYKPDLNQNNWFIRARSFTKKEIEQTYGAKVSIESVDEVSRQTNYNGINDYNIRRNRNVNSAVLYEYFEKPSVSHPKGMFVVVCNDKVLLHRDSLPYKIGDNDTYDFGIVICKFNSRTKEFFGDTIISHTRAVQRSFNRAENLKNLHLSEMAVGKWFYEEGAIDDPNELDALDHSKIKVNIGRKYPDRVKNTGIDGSLFGQSNSIMEVNSVITGISRFRMTGNPNSATRSANALDKVEKRDESSLSSTINNLEFMMTKLYKYLLRLQKNHIGDQVFYDEYDQYYSMIDFKFADVLENDIKLTNKGLIGLTEDEERELLSSLIKMGVFMKEDAQGSVLDSKTKQNLLSQLQLGTLMDFIEDPYIDQMKSQERENEDMFRGSDKVELHPYDNHKAHIEEMDKLFNSSYFYKFKATPQGEGVYKILIKHYNEHKEALDNQLKSQIMQQQMLQKK